MRVRNKPEPTRFDETTARPATHRIPQTRDDVASRSSHHGDFSPAAHHATATSHQAIRHQQSSKSSNEHRNTRQQHSRQPPPPTPESWRALYTPHCSRMDRRGHHAALLLDVIAGAMLQTAQPTS